MSTFSILDRDEWGARPPTKKVAKLRGPAKFLFAHHTVSRAHATDAAELRDVQRVGFQRFSDISYSMMVTSRGGLAEGRGPDRVGAHTLTRDGARQLKAYKGRKWNSTGLAVAVVGNYEEKPLTDRQINAFRYCRHWLIEKEYLRAPKGPYRPWKLGSAPQPGWYCPHMEVNATACPGKHVIAVLDRINEPWVAGEEPGERPGSEHRILREDTISGARLLAWAEKRNATDWFIEYVHALHAVDNRGVDRCIAVAQAAVETGLGRFGGHVKAKWNNPCGLKSKTGDKLAETDPDAWAKFESKSEGARAHFDHLALYAGHLAAPFKDTLDPRHIRAIKGKAETVADLARTWATDVSYAEKIDGYLGEMAATPEPHPVDDEPDDDADLPDITPELRDMLGRVVNQQAALAAETSGLVSATSESLQLHLTQVHDLQDQIADLQRKLGG